MILEKSLNKPNEHDLKLYIGFLFKALSNENVLHIEMFKEMAFQQLKIPNYMKDFYNIEKCKDGNPIKILKTLKEDPLRYMFIFANDKKNQTEHIDILIKLYQHYYVPAMSTFSPMPIVWSEFERDDFNKSLFFLKQMLLNLGAPLLKEAGKIVDILDMLMGKSTPKSTFQIEVSQLFERSKRFFHDFNGLEDPGKLLERFFSTWGICLDHEEQATTLSEIKELKSLLDPGKEAVSITKSLIEKFGIDETKSSFMSLHSDLESFFSRQSLEKSLELSRALFGDDSTESISNLYQFIRDILTSEDSKSVKPGDTSEMMSMICDWKNLPDEGREKLQRRFSTIKNFSSMDFLLKKGKLEYSELLLCVNEFRSRSMDIEKETMTLIGQIISFVVKFSEEELIKEISFLLNTKEETIEHYKTLIKDTKLLTKGGSQSVECLEQFVGQLTNEMAVVFKVYKYLSKAVKTEHIENKLPQSAKKLHSCLDFDQDLSGLYKVIQIVHAEIVNKEITFDKEDVIISGTSYEIEMLRIVIKRVLIKLSLENIIGKWYVKILPYVFAELQLPPVLCKNSISIMILVDHLIETCERTHPDYQFEIIFDTIERLFKLFHFPIVKIDDLRCVQPFIIKSEQRDGFQLTCVLQLISHFDKDKDIKYMAETHQLIQQHILLKREKPHQETDLVFETSEKIIKMLKIDSPDIHDLLNDLKNLCRYTIKSNGKEIADTDVIQYMRDSSKSDEERDILNLLEYCLFLKSTKESDEPLPYFKSLVKSLHYIPNNQYKVI